MHCLSCTLGVKADLRSSTQSRAAFCTFNEDDDYAGEDGHCDGEDNK